MNRSLRTSAAVLATGLVLVACGASADTDSGAAPSSDPVVGSIAEAAALPTDTALAPTETPAAEEPAPDAATDQESEAAASTPEADEQPAATEAPPITAAAAPAAAVLGGRSFASELASESDFAANVLPNLQVDDIRSGQKVNLRNVFPAERPVLFWMWAPH